MAWFINCKLWWVFGICRAFLFYPAHTFIYRLLWKKIFSYGTIVGTREIIYGNLIRLGGSDRGGGTASGSDANDVGDQYDIYMSHSRNPQ